MNKEKLLDYYEMILGTGIVSPDLMESLLLGIRWQEYKKSRNIKNIKFEQGWEEEVTPEYNFSDVIDTTKYNFYKPSKWKWDKWDKWDDTAI